MTRFPRIALLLALALTSLRAEAYHPQWSTALMQRMSGTRLFHHADFNGDGWPDFLAHSTARLNLALFNPNGTFDPYVTIYTGTSVSDTTTAEVTGDGKVDLIVADTATNTITVVPSNGDGTFATPIINNLTITPTQFARGDYNGDGKVDLAVRSHTAALLVVYAGDGAGHFTELARRGTASSLYRIVAGDIDGDGKMDALLSNNAPWQHELYFGRGDGTFDGPVAVAAPAVLPAQLQLADLDDDGDQEIVSCEFRPNSVTVFRNNGSRSFASYDTYTVVTAPIGNPNSIAIGDFSGDGDADIAVSLVNMDAIATLEGNGNGTFRPPVFVNIEPPPEAYDDRFSINAIAAIEFTGDDRLDLVMSADVYVGAFANASGDTRLTLAQDYPVVSTGEKARFTAWLIPPENGLSWYGEPSAPARTGLVTFRNGATVLGTATPVRDGDRDYATFETASLPAGTHIVTADYAGDDSYRPAVALNAVSQRVIGQKTTTTITGTSTAGEPIPWSESWFVSAAVTSPLPGEVTGSFWFFANGQRLYDTHSAAPSGTSSPILLDPGTYQIHVEYSGDETHPPSRSAAIQQVVTKVPTTTSFAHNGEYLASAGQTPQLGVQVDGYGPSGKVHIYNGATLLGTLNAATQSLFTMPALPLGVHYLKAVYEGGSKWLPSESAILRYNVVPQGFVVVATVAADASSIFVSAIYSAQPAPVIYKFYERVGSAAWTHVYTASSPFYGVTAPERGKVYAYRMEAFNASGALLGTSNIDIAVVTVFTDDALRAGIPIKAAHIQQLVSAANLLRAQGGLASISLADAAPGKTIRKSHIDFLSNAIAQGRAACSANASPALTIAAASPVRAAHILQLREALK